ncbi:MAG TPA: Ppx/GppA phosphatase family protein [Pyrinomonadaceae bacterium]|nr:Ppx/GppA phosphatase family protein [Pyrinomonadaceae bacterium]
MKFAAIDIGSNSIKLVVVDAAASDSFAVLAREREVVRLGHETLLKGYIGRAAILGAAECIKRLRSIAEARGAETIVAIATASVREANNAANFISAIEQKTGVRVEVLSGIEEARLIGLAAAQGCSDKRSATLNIDIGGGSTEISIFRDGQPLALFSVKLGAVGLTERFLVSDPPRPNELRDLRAEIQDALERPARELQDQSWDGVTGTSGTILAIGEALRQRAGSGNAKANQGAQPVESVITLKDLSHWNAALCVMNAAQRRDACGMNAKRAEIIVAGGQVLEGTMRALGIKSLRTCDWALREGVIIDRLRQWEAESKPPMPDIDDQKLRGVHAVGKRFGYEEAHSQQVARLAERIFDAVSSSAHMTRHQRLLLSAAALLHDVGYHIAHESHHKHSFYLIENSELTGFSESERGVIANIARYHKGSHPKERHSNFMSLNAADRETVRRLAGILRLADAFDRRHDNRVKDLLCRRVRNVFHIQITSARECAHELEAAERRMDLFENAFDCKVRLSC